MRWREPSGASGGGEGEDVEASLRRLGEGGMVAGGRWCGEAMGAAGRGRWKLGRG